VKLFILVTLALMFIVGNGYAQTSPTDSSGTANTFWKGIDVLKQGTKTVDIFNTGAVNLKYCLVATDTTAGRTRYQPVVDTVQRVVRLVTKSQYVYVKVASGSTCVFRVTAY
jgi:hypothetical protein